MPRPGSFASSVDSLGSSVFSPVAHRIPELRGPVYPLHVGDTWMEPCPEARMEALRTDAHPGMHRYCETPGIPPLVDALLGHVRAQNGLVCERDGLLVTAGATSGLSCALSAVVDPGDEVLILAPFWPLIRGIVRSQRGRAVEVPFYDSVHSADDAVAAVEAARSERTVALYVSTPSNPTGRLVPRAWLEALAEWARRHGLWLLSDEVYESYVYHGTHAGLGPLAPERTLSVYSFSKTYGMAGNRVGYLVGPPEWVAAAHKVSMHSAYHAPTAAKWAALRALEHGKRWVAEARSSYQRAGVAAAAALGVAEPEGSMFLFLDVSRQTAELGMQGFLEACL